MVVRLDMRRPSMDLTIVTGSKRKMSNALLNPWSDSFSFDFTEEVPDFHGVSNMLMGDNDNCYGTTDLPLSTDWDISDPAFFTNISSIDSDKQLHNSEEVEAFFPEFSSQNEVYDNSSSDLESEALSLREGMSSVPETDESSDESEMFAKSVLGVEDNFAVRRNSRKAEAVKPTDIRTSSIMKQITASVSENSINLANKTTPGIQGSKNSLNKRPFEFGSSQKLAHLQKLKNNRRPGMSPEDSSLSASAKRQKISEEDKRTMHNEMERKRREELKDEFCTLKKVLPDLGEEKTPKICILEKANDHIKKLNESLKEMSSTLERNRCDRDRLKDELQLMKSLFAAI